MQFKRTSKILSLLVAAAMVFTLLPISAAAEGCTHQHDETCGYIEEAAPCGHQHDESCGGLSLGDSGNVGTPGNVAAPTGAGIVLFTTNPTTLDLDDPPNSGTTGTVGRYEVFSTSDQNLIKVYGADPIMITGDGSADRWSIWIDEATDVTIADDTTIFADTTGYALNVFGSATITGQGPGITITGIGYKHGIMAGGVTIAGTMGDISGWCGIYANGDITISGTVGDITGTDPGVGPAGIESGISSNGDAMITGTTGVISGAVFSINTPFGSTTIDSGGQATLSGKHNTDITVSNGGLLKAVDTLSAKEAGQKIVLESGSMVEGMGSQFNDRGTVFTASGQVTVDAANAAPSASGLSAGTYVWDGSAFAKAAATGTMDLGASTNAVPDLSQSASGPGWAWDASTATLTLDSSYSHSGSDNNIFIRCDPSDRITLLLTGDVTISSIGMGISVMGIGGQGLGGSLTVRAGSHTLDVSAVVDAIQAHNGLAIESGTVVAVGRYLGCGLVSYNGDVAITGSANVTATGYTDPTDPIWQFNGIQAAGNVLIDTSGVVNVTGGKGAIMAEGSVTIERGTVDADGGSFALLGESGGIHITGGTVTTNTTGSANGDIHGDLTVSGSGTQVAINGDVLAGFSSGSGNLTVSGGNVTVTGTVEGTTTHTGGTLNGVQAGGTDTTPSTPGGSGTITTASVAQTTLTLNWAKATDAVTAQGALKYYVYRSNSGNLGTAANCATNGTLLNTGGTADIATYNVTGLTANTTYYFNVVVEDAAGNRAAYTMKSQTTAAGGGNNNGGGGGGSTTPTTPTVPETGDNKLTTPKGQPPVVDKNGNTTLPGGGTVETPGGGTIDAPAGTTIDKDGNVTIPAGKEAEVTLPGGTEVTLPGGSTIANNGNITIPPGKEADITLPGGTEITLPGGSTISDRGNITTGGSTQVSLPGDKMIDIPTGSTISGDGKLTVGSGGATVSYGDGGTLHIEEDTVLILDAETPLGYFVSIANPFADVNTGNWFYDNVMFTYTHGLFSGTSPNAFSPGASMTRAMLLTVLARLSGEDVSGGQTWYSKAVEWATENGISDGTNLNGNITREQIAVMMYNYMKYKGYDMPTSSAAAFADEGSISPWAIDAMRAMQAMGIISGRPGNVCDPQDTATRAEVATIFARFVEALAK